MARRKIAILGGGMAGLAAAYELTKSPSLARDNSVTIYQLGWRLGGKAASGRSADGRILEHGLHIWFGCYDNAFRLLRHVYDQWRPNPQSPIKKWRQAFVPQNYALFGYRDAAGRYGYHEVTFDPNEKEPGVGGVGSSVWDLAITLYELARQLLAREIELDVSGQGMVALTDLQHLRAFHHQAVLAWSVSAVVSSAAHAPSIDVRRDAVVVATREAEAALKRGVELLPLPTPGQRLALEAMELAGAICRGALIDVLWHGKSLDDLDTQEMSDWLRQYGSTLTTANSTLLRTMYDTFFWYGEGDMARPSVGAGTGIAVILRVLCTYKEAITFKMTAGMGEVVIAPLFETLKQRGVRFEFFRKVTQLELAADKKAVRRIHLDRQADIHGGNLYRPTFTAPDGLICWPAEPLWDQVVNGAALQKKGVNFESHWCDTRAGTEVLDWNTDANSTGASFTHVILAVSLGAYKKLNPDAGMCDELLAANRQFREMADSIGLVPSQSAQLWCTKPSVQLGPWHPDYESVGGPAPQVIWADMSRLLVHEGQAGSAEAPQSLHYGCGTYGTSLYREPLASAKDPLATAEKEVKAALKAWLESEAGALWPAAVQGGAFDWTVLWDPANRNGPERLDAQFTRANVSPTECCPGTEPGTSQHRLRSNESGFKNLFLAGCYLRTGLNTTCIEGAVMSGMQASRAICGSPTEIVGENFGRGGLSARSSVESLVPADRTLPKYVSQLGMGQMSHEAPLFVGGAHMHGFIIPASNAAMQALVDQNLNKPAELAGNPLRFRVLGNSTMLAFMRAEAAGSISNSNNIGTMDDREAAFFILLWQSGGLSVPRITAWIPYLFIDRPIGMTMGREVWGYVKSAGVIRLPFEPIEPSETYRANTTIFDTHNPASRAREADILNLRRPQQGGNVSSLFERATTWTSLDQILTGLVPELGALLADYSLGVGFSVVNLKQFRDVRMSQLACYQALVDCPMDLGGNIQAGLLDTTGFTLDILTCDSHAIVTQLGLRATLGRPITTMPIHKGFWARMDFTAQHGRVLWEAR